MVDGFLNMCGSELITKQKFRYLSVNSPHLTLTLILTLTLTLLLGLTLAVNSGVGELTDKYGNFCACLLFSSDGPFKGT